MIVCSISKSLSPGIQSPQDPRGGERLRSKLGRIWKPYRYGDKPPKVGDIVTFRQDVIHENPCEDPDCQKIDEHNAGSLLIPFLVTQVIDPCVGCKGEGYTGGHSGSDGYADTCSACAGQRWFALHERV